MFIYEFYRSLTIRGRIIALGGLYSLAIVATGLAGRHAEAETFYAVLAVSLVTGGITTGMCIASILEPLLRITGYLRDMAKGDLTNTVKAKRKTEFSAVLNTMHDMQQFLKTVIADIQRAAERLSETSTVLNASSAQMAAGTDEASDKSRSVTTAVDQLSSIIAAISESCEDMKQKASETEKATESGEAVVMRMNGVMHEIETMVASATQAVGDLGTNSDKIGTIVVAIGEIADQTNLLALNAAIEAARAGEQGRGFAVVADEVRKLAERTSTATREIQGIIASLQNDVKNVAGAMEKSGASVQSGTADVRQSSQAMETIKTQIGPLIGRVAQVASASEEQSAAAADITANMHHISDVIVDSAQVARETQDRAAGLAGAAADLKTLVGRFKV
ncbi:methyl-accepting chemotaxis protein [Propionivibrio dicarboxylicus]|uniref:Methyl-accepting chemotaxis protein n=1 Tax=Propionivibrio dicarboxylicus TaxID=83767 RepID=A0A1G8AC23_9RHOO|nr:methyl-accepting chemotaxis protein [Propionivibrio dicarboxylicus]SDH18575.1 Methyl-accepting chemotaxis protein [Propionivibrio dicarboxylicus]